ncbi:MAG: carboxylate--amine ligase [Promicromonosporaceae bacterium]|nr:carboxylate--amine ligase [Promicromonosporaceae bacterium]
MPTRRQNVFFPDVQPVILGGDIGAYSLARAFFEGLRVRSIVISGISTGIMRYSRFVSHITLPNFDDDDAALLRKLAGISHAHTGNSLLLVASADWLVKFLVTHRERLSELGFTVPYADPEPFEVMTDKAGFYEACEKAGVPYPKTLVYPVTGEGEISLDLTGFTFPLIAKAASTSAYHDIEFEGKKKVHKVDSAAELTTLLRDVARAGYQGDFIIQDFIPGDDSGMRILTCYCDKNSNVRFSAYGEVLLEEHAPGALGNPAAIVTKPNPEAVAHATRLLRECGWKGYANFDLKYDPRDGVTKFFELNPRLGRSNYYITGAGANPILFYVSEWLRGEDPDPIRVLGSKAPIDQAGEIDREHLYTVVPGALLLRYLFDPRQHAEAAHLLHRPSRNSNPMWSHFEKHPRRIAYVLAQQVNQWRKFHRFYPLAKARADYVQASG